MKEAAFVLFAFFCGNFLSGKARPAAALVRNSIDCIVPGNLPFFP